MSRDQHAVLIVPRSRAVIVSAEHGGMRVPEAYRARFHGHEALLETHRGWDPGTAELARELAHAFGVEPFVTDVTRLLVDLNRSAHHPRVFSDLTRPLPPVERREILDRYHTPHRARVMQAVAAHVDAGETVLHIGVHSFTPVLDGQERPAELALLYDPARLPERALAERWCRALRIRLPGLRVRRNYPYRGRSDGLTTTLRGQFPPERYLGMEVEVNQALLDRDLRFPAWIPRALLETCPDP